MAAQGVLQIGRETRLLGLVRNCGVLLDGVKVGEVGAGKTLQISVDAGEHTVQARLSWVVSAPISVTIRTGQTTSIGFALPRMFELHRALLGPFYGPLYFTWSKT